MPPVFVDAYRQAGVYTGRILKGEKPQTCHHSVGQVRADDQPQDCKALSLDVPLLLQQRADEVIE